MTHEGKATMGAMMTCSTCKTPIGRVLPDGLRLRRKGKRMFFRPDFPPTGYLEVWCDGCQVEGDFDVASAIRQARGRTSIPVRVWRVFASRQNALRSF